ncbi:hypothetical protein RRG08_057521 [Elysia crispata]|uniref:Uncharacterized protein n=1 Tax=Elysia crispata TaxID=231223 RepID=A0AAE1EAJ9_9GAST|nr:hypothetical protein RRG08_057521 [Elysia crispata]
MALWKAADTLKKQYGKKRIKVTQTAHKKKKQLKEQDLDLVPTSSILVGTSAKYMLDYRDQSVSDMEEEGCLFKEQPKECSTGRFSKEHAREYPTGRA